ncbi:MAG: signal peptidase II [Candidatus Wallbacteria bacterium]|nr:signal peptidase II [Candidatus Wallbacteria bacterium]
MIRAIEFLLLYSLLSVLAIAGIIFIWPVFLVRHAWTLLRNGLPTLAPAAVLLACDIASKQIATDKLANRPAVPLVEGLLSLEYTRNYGAAFGIFQHQQWLFVLVAVTAGIIIFILSINGQPKPAYLRVAYGFLLSGALGNLRDRVCFGFVIDFIHLKGFPVFNVADLSIDIGLGLIFWYILNEEKRACIRKSSD